VSRPAVPLRAIRDIWRAYTAAGGDERGRAVVRYTLCSWTGLLPLFPPKGSVLDVGCGNGLLFFLLDREAPGARRLTGIDHDPARVEIARALGIPGAEFLAGDVASLPAETFDAASVIHVLYLIPLHRRREFIAQVLRALRPGGTLILALNVTRPRWKAAVAYWQEVLMVNGLGLTKGTSIAFQSLEEYVAHVEACGATVLTARRADRGRPYSHAVLVARKADASA
jgi:SAM-dependent methyltransferase